MKERGIIFGGPMVRALLAGTKTQTRRIAKFVAIEQGFNLGFSGVEAGHYCTGVPSSGHVLYSRRGDGVWEQRTKPLHCPYGVPGDRLWVREAFALSARDPEAFDDRDAKDPSHWDGAVYRATYEGGEWERHDGEGGRSRIDPPWRSPLYLPRWASRITLEITDVRVQRLTDISEEDARAEGIAPLPLQEGQRGCWWTADATAGAELHGRAARLAFEKLWQSINGKTSAWSANAWVWSLSFRKVTP